MRFELKDIGYSRRLISRDLTASELAALLDAFEGAFMIKTEGYGADAKHELDKESKPSDCWNIIDGNDDSIPRDLRIKAKETENKAVRAQKTNKKAA